MAFQAVPNTAEAVITYLGNTVIMKNVVYGEKAGGYDLADLAVLASAVDAAVATHWLPKQSEDVLYQQTVVRGLAFENDQEITIGTGSALGQLPLGSLPGNATVSIKKSSGFTGRAARGRLYWIGLARSQLAVNENQLLATAANDIEAAVDEVRMAIEATVWSAVLVSRFLNLAKRPTGVTFPWIDSLAVNVNVDSMRPRLLK